MYRTVLRYSPFFFFTPSKQRGGACRPREKHFIKKFIGGRDISQMGIGDKERLVEKILNGIYGIDINPLSVLAARVNFYLCTRELLADYQDDIEGRSGTASLLG